MIKLFIKLFVLTTVSLGTTAAQVFTNGSFESATINPGGYVTLPTGSAAIDGWIVTGSIDYIGSWWVASDSSRSVDLNSTIPGSIVQSFTTMPGSDYLVLFDMAGNVDGGPTIKTLRVEAAETSLDLTFDITGHTHSDMGWTEMSFGFTAVDTVTTLEFISITPGAYGPAIDNVRVELATAVGEFPNGIPVSFDLRQNYPNPFNPVTRIQYTIGSSQHVLLKVYDLLGREVATLVDQEKPAGEYSVEFDGSRLSSGLYFYTIETGNFRETRKMMLMR